ncbi:MAG: hypothetical protein J2P25_05865, partial [Nocardiopsaceae bacterium]|nr:hypothetical protein [Nocardiopsaceae bacterium]
MIRRKSGPTRQVPGSADGYPQAEEPYLEAQAYPVDPGYQGSGGEPRPADAPVGGPYTRPERAMPP